MLAKIIAQVGIFDNRSLSGGSSPFFRGGESDFPAWINLSSAFVIELLSCGSFVTRLIHVVSQRSPRDEKRMKGPEIPTEDINKGVSTKPTTFPRWNPPMDIPTAVARSWLGNHLHNWRNIQTQLFLNMQNIFFQLHKAIIYKEPMILNLNICRTGHCLQLEHKRFTWLICH